MTMCVACLLLWLQGTITQVFENAVQQPTFVAMYADLCHELDAVRGRQGVI